MFIAGLRNEICKQLIIFRRYLEFSMLIPNLQKNGVSTYTSFTANIYTKKLLNSRFFAANRHSTESYKKTQTQAYHLSQSCIEVLCMSSGF